MTKQKNYGESQEDFEQRLNKLPTFRRIYGKGDW
jgi:hypothetical protein